MQVLQRLNLLVLVACTASAAVAGDATPSPEIVVGMSTVLSGPASDLGQEMRQGVLAAFERANRAGGVHGRRLRLIALDDGYEPARTAPNMRQLLEKDNVLAVIGNVGTPTAIAAIPIANEQKTLFFAPFTGAGLLHRKPQDRYVFNYRASYEEETAAMIDALIGPGGLKPEDIAAFTQSDGYGDAGFNGIVSALKRHGLTGEKQVLHVRYERNTLAVENALASLLYARHEPRAVVMILGAYAPCAKFIKLAHESGLKAVFINMSFVGSEALAAALGKLPVQVIVTQVVPHPADARVPIVHEYQLDKCRKISATNARLVSQGVKRQVNALEDRTAELSREIAERDKTEQDLRRFRQHQETIFNSISEGIFLIDPDGVVIFANPAAARLVGWDITELLGKPAHATMHHSHADGTDYPKSECRIDQRLKMEGTFRVNDEVFWRKDGTSFPVEYTTTPMRGRDAQISGAVVVVTDITERKRADRALRATNKQLIEISRRAGMAEVATGILHNVGNVLNSVNVSASVVSNQLRNSRVSKLAVAVKILTEHASDLADYLAKDDRKFAEVPPIQADKHKLMQILVNLIKNAKQAMAASDVKTLTLKLELPGRGGVRVSVCDTGYGIAAENMTRIFAHGFTTKRDGHGFGLHSSALAAKDINGSLRVQSDGVGHGAVFVLDLPSAIQQTLAV